MALATDEYPYGLVGIGDMVLFCLAAPIALIVSSMIARQHSDPGVIRRAKLTGIFSTLVVLLLFVVLRLFPIGFLLWFLV